MKTTLLLIVLAGPVSGCGWFGRAAATVTGYSTHCVEGVRYIQFASGATVMYSADGKIRAC